MSHLSSISSAQCSWIIYDNIKDVCESLCSVIVVIVVVVIIITMSCPIYPTPSQALLFLGIIRQRYVYGCVG